MSTFVLATKLCIPPPRADRVQRPRLVERINAGLVPEGADRDGSPPVPGFARRLTLVSAPAGFGKTTLVTAWLAASQHARTWLSLDEADNDPARFFTYLLAAVQQVDPNVGLSAMTMLQAPQPPAPEALLTSLINDVAATPQPFLLVLDDYHVIQTLLVHQLLAALLEHMPAQMHLVIVTREDPPAPLSRLRARGQILDVRQGDLRFTEEETGSFLRKVMGLDISSEDVAALQRRTEGWIAGLQLAALSMQRREDIPQFVADFSGSHRYILDYLAEEVFRRQSPDVQGFLLQTSVLDRLTAPLCNAVTGRDDAQQVLLGLDQGNLFVVRLDETRQWYRYHRLFRDLLRIHGQALDRATLHLRAARWYAQNGYLEEAMDHALVAEDWDEAERLVEAAAAQALNLGRYATVGRWLDAMPEERVRSSPALATLRGWVLLPMGQFDAAESWAALAEDLLPAEAPAMIRALVASLQIMLVHVRSDLPRVIDLAQQALELLAAGDPYGLRGVALGNLASATMQSGDVLAATRAYREMARLGEQAGHVISMVSAWSSLAWLHYLQNEPREAQALCQQAIERAVGPRGNPLTLAGQAYIMLGTIAYERNDLALAGQHLSLGVELARQAGPNTNAMQAAFLLAWILTLTGKREAALEIVSGVRQAVAQLNLPQAEAYVAACNAGLSLRLGDVQAAARWAQDAALPLAGGPQFSQEGEYLTRARVLLAQGRSDEAQALLDNLEAFASARGLERSQLTLHLLRAQVEQARGQSAEARAALEEAVRLAAPLGYLRAFLDEGQAVRAMLPRVRHCDPAFVDRVLEAFAGERGASWAPTAGEMAAQALVEPLSQRELEVLGLVAEGLTNREIAERLLIAVGTVKTHVHNVYGKLAVGRRTEAVARARELELV